MPREEKIEASLANPQLPGAMKLGALKEITKARMRHQFANLISQEMPNVQDALREVKADNPKVYIDQFIALAEFALPKMKAVEVDHGSESGNSAKNLSMNDLMRLAFEPEPDDQVVAEQ
jgi:hypothetical protein